jgi:hypothetical protein
MPPKTSSIKPSSISRALCSDGSLWRRLAMRRTLRALAAAQTGSFSEYALTADRIKLESIAFRVGRCRTAFKAATHQRRCWSHMEASCRNGCAAGGVNLSLPVRDTLPVRWIQLTPLEDRLQTRRLNPAGFSCDEWTEGLSVKPACVILLTVERGNGV